MTKTELMKINNMLFSSDLESKELGISLILSDKKFCKDNNINNLYIQSGFSYTSNGWVMDSDFYMTPLIYIIFNDRQVQLYETAKLNFKYD